MPAGAPGTRSSYTRVGATAVNSPLADAGALDVVKYPTTSTSTSSTRASVTDNEPSEATGTTARLARMSPLPLVLTFDASGAAEPPAWAVANPLCGADVPRAVSTMTAAPTPAAAGTPS